MRSITFVALTALSGGALGQILGESCHPHPVPGLLHLSTKLCYPQFCPAPKTHTYQGIGTLPYNFTSTPPGSNKNVTVTFTPTPNMYGYRLEEICSPSIGLANTHLGCTGNNCPPSPPGSPPKAPYTTSNAPVGCSAITPLPTLAKMVDLDLIAVWIMLIVYLFYALAMVCEEFLVPAINILCVKTGIPDDVAGATLLAAGCNSPEFFASIIGIFVADSTVGVGTVIGSAPFNLCCITGGASLAMGGALCLDPWLMIRELFGLLTALTLFLIFDADYIIQWWEALTLVLFYAFVYVPLLAYSDRVKRFLLYVVTGGKRPGGATLLDEEDPNVLGIDFRTGATSLKLNEIASTDDLPLQYGTGMRGAVAASLSRSLAGTQRVTFGITDLMQESIKHRSVKKMGDEGIQLQVELQPVAISQGVGNGRNGGTNTAAAGGIGGPSSTLSELVDQCRKRCEAYPDAENGFTGQLMKKPRGLTKVRVRGIHWQPRYFVLDHHPTNPMRYSHASQVTKFVTLPLQSVSHIERVGLEEIHLFTPKETYKLRLAYGEPPTTMQRWFDQIVVKIDEMGYSPAPPVELVGEAPDEGEHEHHAPWHQMPDSTFAMVMHILTFPLKAMVFTTTPNVLIKKNERYYPLTIVVSMFWLAIFATLMTDVIEYLGCGIGVGSTVMGLSLGAIGTSFPNLYASVLVARAGQGGMAICQAIASNTFNVCICLGLLWFLHTIGLGSCDYGSHGELHGICGGCYAPSGFQPMCPFWEGTNNPFGSAPGSTKGAIVVSLIWIIFFVITLALSKMYVRKWAAYAMFSIYIIYMTYEFAAAFGAPITLCISPINVCI